MWFALKYYHHSVQYYWLGKRASLVILIKTSPRFVAVVVLAKKSPPREGI